MSQRILLIQLGFLGDIVLSTPVIAEIRNRFPDAEISVLTTKLGVSLLENDPLVTDCIGYDKRGAQRGPGGLFQLVRELRSRHFDRVYSLHRSYRTAVLTAFSGSRWSAGFTDAHGSFLYSSRLQRGRGGHQVERNLLILSKPGQEDDYLKENRERFRSIPLRLYTRVGIPSGEDLMRAKGGGEESPLGIPYVALAPGSVWATKQWPVSGYREVAQQLLDKGLRVVLLGNEQERALVNKLVSDLPVIDLVGKTDLSELISVVQDAYAVVCNDSFLLHIASAKRVPTVAIFCSTSPEMGFGPWANKRATVLGDESLSCRPCYRTGRRYCPLGTFACGHNVKVDDVLAALESVTESARWPSSGEKSHE